MLYAHPHTQSCAPSRLFPHRCFSNFLTRPSSLHQKLSLSLGWVTSFIPLRPLESWTGLPRCEVEVLAAPYNCPLILTLLTPMTAAHCLLSEWEAVCSLPRFQESLSGLSLNLFRGWGTWVMPVPLFCGCSIPLWMFLFGAFERGFEGKGECRYTLREFA